MRVWFAVFSRSPRLFPALLASGFLLLGCGSVSSAPTSPKATSTPHAERYRAVSTTATKTYLGVVSETRALIGIVLDGTQARAYACDGTPSRLATLAEWFAGQVRGSRVQESLLDQARLTVQLTSQSANGTLTRPTGRVYPYTIPRVPTTTQVGVFEGTALIAGQRYHAGWLVLPGGDQRGAASYYPAGPVRGGTVIARLAEFPSGPV
jgi:hypothetical protein